MHRPAINTGFQFLVLATVLCGVSLLILQVFVSIQPEEVHAQPASGCADGTTEQNFGTLPNGDGVHGCNTNNVPYANAGSACAPGFRVGDLVNDAGLSSMLSGIPSNYPAPGRRTVHMGGDPGPHTGVSTVVFGTTAHFCWGTPRALACNNATNAPNIHPWHVDSIAQWGAEEKAYKNGVLVSTKNVFGGVDVVPSGAICVGTPPPPPITPCDGVWNTPGQHTCEVPAGVTQLVADVRGAAGDRGYWTLALSGAGGLGDRVQHILQVTPGQMLNLFVGGQGFIDDQSSGGTTRERPMGGFNGGGNGSIDRCGLGTNIVPHGGGGGGASDIRIGGTALTDRVVVAGGGGGGGGDTGRNRNAISLLPPPGDGGARGGWAAGG